MSKVVENKIKSNSNEKKAVISLQNVCKSYGQKKVLHNITFDIYEGDRIAFLGGNGSGKSTTMEIIAKVREATSGTIKYDPKLVLGIQFQESIYPMGITVEALINFYLTRYDQNKINPNRVKELLKVFRLEKFFKKQVFNMSGGQKQRLNILLALIHSPNFLILDELSTGLDIKVRRELRRFIIKYLEDNPKTSMILVTHSMGEAEEMTNRVIVLDWGVLKYDLPIKEVQAKHGDLETFANLIFEQMYLENPNRTEEEDID